MNVEAELHIKLFSGGAPKGIPVVRYDHFGERHIIGKVIDFQSTSTGIKVSMRLDEQETIEEISATMPPIYFSEAIPYA